VQKATEEQARILDARMKYEEMVFNKEKVAQEAETARQAAIAAQAEAERQVADLARQRAENRVLVSDQDMQYAAVRHPLGPATRVTINT
jgi:hypothetical protein